MPAITAMDDPYMLMPTKFGGRVSLFQPDPDSIDIRDIAAGLTRRFRWSAQSDLTVAQHSVAVSRRLGGYEAQWGLLHDAAEAYLPDVCRPLKSRLLVETTDPRIGAKAWRQFREIEDQILRAIAKRFGLAWPMPVAVAEADDREMAREARDLFGDAALAQAAYPEPLVIQPWPVVENQFLRRFTELFREPC